MYDADITPGCYGNNAQAHYMSCKLPMAPGQQVPNVLSYAPIKPENRGLWVDYRLCPDEAVVFIGKTLPACRHFSYISYLSTRYFPEEGQARRIFGSLGDSVNNSTINTAGTPGGGEGDVFESDTVIIITADAGTERRVRESLAAAGYPMDTVNTNVIPSGLVRMGLVKEDDTFAIVHRVAFFEDKAAGQDYMAAAQGTVLRLTPGDAWQPEPFEGSRLRVRGTGDTAELELAGALERLERAIMEKHGGSSETELGTDIWLLRGYDAIQRGTDALGDNDDTFYLWTNTLTLGDDPEEFVIVCGVNHAALGKVVYNNFSVYGNDIMNGVGGVDDSLQAGSAEEHLPSDPDAKYLYVWKVARSAGEDPHCLELPVGPGALGIPLEARILLGFRIYLEKVTKTGPLWFEMLYDRAIEFSPSR